MDHRGDKYKYKYTQLKKKLSINQSGGNSEKLTKMAWNIVIASSYVARNSTPHFDGLGYWNKIKPLLEGIKKTDDDIVWNRDHENMRDFIHSLDLQENDGSGKLIEPNHFLLQQANLPYKDKRIPSFHRLIQIALNIGQSLARPVDVETLSDENKERLSEFKNRSIETYMTPDNYSKFDFRQEHFDKLIDLLYTN